KRDKYTAEATLSLLEILKSSVNATSSANVIDEKHQEVIDSLRVMIAHAGDTSNLVLDPDLDSYYLMDIVLLALPQNQDRLQKISAFFDGILKDHKTTASDFTQLGVMAALLQESDLDRIVADVQTVISEDSNFYGANGKVQSRMRTDLYSYKIKVESVIASLKQMSTKGANVISKGEFQSQIDAARLQSFALWSGYVSILDELLSARISSYTSMKIKAMVVSFVSVLIFAMIALFTIRRISKTMAAIVQHISSESETLSDVTQLVASASKNLSTATTQQAAAIQETVASMEEISSMLMNTSTNAQAGQTITEHGIEKSSEGKALVDKMKISMSDIKDSQSKLKELVALISVIQSKTQVINDIVFETRLLSFNASIEAARAGVHGRGFAVVAEEVGKLASMSGKAADEINALLASSSSDVSNIVSATQGRVDSGILVSSEAAANFMSVSETLSKIGESVRSITSAAREQEAGVRQTNEAMNQMDKLTQSNSAQADELAQQADRLESGAKSLRTAVQQMNVIVFGEKGSSFPTTAYKEQFIPRPGDQLVVKSSANRVDRKSSGANAHGIAKTKVTSDSENGRKKAS
ncbi:MAG: methyl-accepting chemotaxis protein, partial [Proteobacteria bacterium]|nr:methyl-accepting chemotaxis protein [Pseudomonadota bacterium]